MNTKLFNGLVAATTLAGVVATAGSASAASLSYTTSTPTQKTNVINQALSIQQFDSSLGTLESVVLDFSGDLAGNAKFESMDALPATINVTWGGILSIVNSNLNLAGLSPIYITQNMSYDVSADDETLDFGGTSGKTINNLTASSSQTKTFNSASDLGIFTGLGNVNFLYSAQAVSSFTGTGNITSVATTLANAKLKVTYNYKSVPEPSALFGIGLIAGFGLWSKNKKLAMVKS
ncbi:choice-of-anchor E domain-containing protein [Cylindrospermum sp. FACHB-282]|uniref:choice-of-anchor E domain-containing protein n=1 Tax=Cylindrospermum sp. FACHB-282 TaxID=2692794 RepID=UPI00168200B8|nr:PEP-CTERM sorting domain-containing protein [Cylindrospermum sp. FACHB-282]MBD2386810.1 PEP-CTERM sorting domain-containing protein [Cylindrospermum sp. FACHB-282]